MEKSIVQKRVDLYFEWLLALYANDETYYEVTLMDGIPDGDDPHTVMEDLNNGEYDDYIDDMIDLYARAKKRYGKHGWYVNEVLYKDEDKAIDAITKDIMNGGNDNEKY